MTSPVPLPKRHHDTIICEHGYYCKDSLKYANLQLPSATGTPSIAIALVCLLDVKAYFTWPSCKTMVRVFAIKFYHLDIQFVRPVAQSTE